MANHSAAFFNYTFLSCNYPSNMSDASSYNRPGGSVAVPRRTISVAPGPARPALAGPLFEQERP